MSSVPYSHQHSRSWHTERVAAHTLSARRRQNRGRQRKAHPLRVAQVCASVQRGTHGLNVAFAGGVEQLLIHAALIRDCWRDGRARSDVGRARRMMLRALLAWRETAAQCACTAR